MKKYCKVAGHTFMLEALAENFCFLANYEPFECATHSNEALLFNLTVGDFSPQVEMELMGDFVNDVAHISVSGITGGFSFRIAIPSSNECCLLQTNDKYTCGCVRLNGSDNERFFGLNNALMIMYAFASARHDTLLLHASVIENEGKGYLFLGKSGTGKSTHSRLWLQHIPGSTLLNDDNPVIRIENGTATVYGSPWSGKTPCYINSFVNVGAIVRLRQKPENRIKRLLSLQAYAAVLPACSSMRWEEGIASGIHHTIEKLIAIIECYQLDCLPDSAAAQLCYNTIR